MSDREVEKGKFYNKKKYNRNDRNEQKLYGRNNRSMFKADKEGKDNENGSKLKVKQPQILIKPRERLEEQVLSPKHKDKEDITSNKEAPVTITNDGQLFPNAKPMHKAVKLLDDGILYNDNLQDYMTEASDFLVVGIVGSQGTGKSTIMNILASGKYLTLLTKTKKSPGDIFEENTKHCIFKQESYDDCENCTHTTSGIDMYITENRTILLDCQPFMSPSVIDELMHNELKRTNLLDFSTIDNVGELQGLQHIAFLMSVCHVVIFLQDCILDINNIRFLLTAEMLKPTMTNNEDEYLEQFPHLLILQNKAQLEDFSQLNFKHLQQIYQNIFKGSKLHLDSSMGLGTGKAIPNLNPENCGAPINLFLLPDFDNYDGTCPGYPPHKQLLHTFRKNVFCVTKYPLSHVNLTEKTWLTYCTKVWEHVKKSSFYVEYAKVLP